MSEKILRNPLILALDTEDENLINSLMEKIGSQVGGVKVGPRLALRKGAQYMKDLAKKAPVFFDPKFFDIPNTMEASIQTAFDLGASLVTIHAVSGPEALKKMATLEAKLNQQRPFKILAVTILTSWDQNSLPVAYKSQSVEEHVKALGNEAKQAGLSGLVCSAHELSIFQNQNLFLVTPGIRLHKDPSHIQAHDQKRVATPKEAVTAGASGIVVGRAILEAASPETVVQEILKEIL